MDKRLGISGRIAAAFQNSAMTPLLALVGLLMGLFAVIITPKEEEPQIDVTFADVYIPFPGAKLQKWRAWLQLRQSKSSLKFRVSIKSIPFPSRWRHDRRDL